MTEDESRTGSSSVEPTPIAAELQALSDALVGLRLRDEELANVLAQVFTVVTAEAVRSSRFAKGLSRALSARQTGPESAPRVGSRPSNRRKSGPFDPYAVYAEGQEAGLRVRLGSLSLEELRDIVAEHGMDTDRLAMKWKVPQRVVDRIVERVMERSWKGSAFR